MSFLFFLYFNTCIHPFFFFFFGDIVSCKIYPILMLFILGVLCSLILQYSALSLFILLNVHIYCICKIGQNVYDTNLIILASHQLTDIFKKKNVYAIVGRKIFSTMKYLLRVTTTMRNLSYIWQGN